MLLSLVQASETGRKPLKNAWDSKALRPRGRGKTVLGLTLASVVFGELECINISLQSKIQTVSAMQAAVNHIGLLLREREITRATLHCMRKL